MDEALRFSYVLPADKVGVWFADPYVRGRVIDLSARGSRELGMLREGLMMTSERQIWEAAILLVRRHGEDAAEVAEREAARRGQGDDELTYVVWRWIARATAELVKAEPSAREHVH
jgi:rare lipoprotein A (peptidoglycan hydrolase)